MERRWEERTSAPAVRCGGCGHPPCAGPTTRTYGSCSVLYEKGSLATQSLPAAISSTKNEPSMPLDIVQKCGNLFTAKRSVSQSVYLVVSYRGGRLAF
jgi:hypothetical protein